MFDAQLRPLIDRLLNPIGRGLVTLGVTANQVTMIGATFGLIAAGFVAAGLFYPALWFVIANRVIDGLDGAVARASRSSDFGGFLILLVILSFTVPFHWLLRWRGQKPRLQQRF